MKVKEQLWDGSDVSDNNSQFNPDNVGYPDEQEFDCLSCGQGNYKQEIEDNDGQVIEADICDNCGADWSLRPKADF